MAQPVTGPFNSFVEEINTFKDERSGWRQAKPYDKPLPYYRDYWRQKSRTTAWSPTWQYMVQWMDIWCSGADVNGLKISVYDKLLAKLGPEAGLGTSLVEFGQARAMVTERLVQLAQGARQLRKWDFSGVAKTFGLGSTPTGVSKAKSFGRNWLEFHFGWAPLVGDIYGAMEVLDNPLSDVTIRARSRRPFHWDSGYAYGDWYGCAGELVRNRWRTYASGTMSVEYGLKCAVTNPNLRLLQQLGLVNPVALAWEVVPYSFVLDWFTNLGQVISQSSDFCGLTVTDSYTTTCRKYQKVRYEAFTSPCYLPEFSFWEWWGVNMRREVGIQTPDLAFRPLKLPSWQRGLTASSLLVKYLKG